MNKLALALILSVSLVGCGKSSTSPKKTSHRAVQEQSGCPEGKFKEWDSDDCEDLLDALDLNEVLKKKPKPKVKPKPKAKKWQPKKATVKVKKVVKYKVRKK